MHHEIPSTPPSFVPEFFGRVVTSDKTWVSHTSLTKKKKQH
jgi:hypothetical protein